MISDLLKNKTIQEKARIKSEEITKLDHKGIYEDLNYDVKVEILSLNKIEINGQHGVEILARAWKGIKQLGFGKDNDVEIERFRIFNSPIKAPDGTKRIVNLDGKQNEILDNFTENPVRAIQLTLVHIISLVGKISDKVISGKVGNTTSTFFPSLDGWVREETEASWATIIAAAGDTAEDSGANNPFSFCEFIDGVTSNTWQQNVRSIFLFDTSSIPDGDTIDSATMSLWVTSKLDEATAQNPDINVYASTPASDTALVAGDYAQTGSTAFSTAITFANVTTDAYNDFVLNASGLANISKTGVSKFSAKNANYDAAASAPGWTTSGRTHRIRGQWVETAGTANDPKLVVVHTSPALTISVNESITVAENITLLEISAININNLITITDVVTLLITNFVNIFDSITVTDFVTLALVYDINTNDSVIITENINFLLQTLGINVNNSVTINESLSFTLINLLSIFDLVTVTESLSFTYINNVSINDLITIYENNIVIGMSINWSNRTGQTSVWVDIHREASPSYSP